MDTKLEKIFVWHSQGVNVEQTESCPLMLLPCMSREGLKYGMYIRSKSRRKSSTEWGVAYDGRARCETHHITWSSTDCVLLRNYLSGLHLHRLCATGMLLWGFLALSTCMRPDQLSSMNKPQRNLGSPESMTSTTC